MTNPLFPIKPTMVISVCSSFISPQRKFSFPICLLLMANGNKLFCWNAILLIFALVNAEDHWKGEKHEHLPFDLCILEACRLRISALGAHIPTCQALDLPTEFNPWDAPTLVSGLPRAISGLLQFAVLLPQARREGCTHSPERPWEASASCSWNPCLAASRIRASFWWNTLNAVFYLNPDFSSHFASTLIFSLSFWLLLTFFWSTSCLLLSPTHLSSVFNNNTSRWGVKKQGWRSLSSTPTQSKPRDWAFDSFNIPLLSWG